MDHWTSTINDGKHYGPVEFARYIMIKQNNENCQMLKNATADTLEHNDTAEA
jgi:hypothetical protein